MSFIAPRERKHWSTRTILAGMYLLVIAGAVTMVYPFALMLSGSVKSELDFDQFELVPSFLHDDEILFRKYERARYKANMWRYQLAAKSTLEMFEDIPLPEVVAARAEDLRRFMNEADLPVGFTSVGFTHGDGTQPRVLRLWRAFLHKRFGGDLDALNAALAMTVRQWNDLRVPETELFSRGNAIGETAYELLYWREFRPTLPADVFWPVHIEGVFFSHVRNQFGRDIGALNAKLGTSFVTFAEIPLPRRRPAGEAIEPLWDEFVGEQLHPLFIKHDGDAIALDTFAYRYRDWLKAQYKTIDALNAAWNTHYTTFETIPLDLANYDAYLLRENRGAIAWEFFSRNYRYAFDYLVVRGRAFWVTFVYVALNVLLHMLVNPLAAYALSRYPLRLGHWILLFCILTMAFPAEVGAIPRFLLLRELGLLNTIWALVLPGAAHGFSIFILKGFFDGLPSELYEAGVIEGAPEHWLFRNVTLSLTKPILAVTAFGAFTSAYGAFMFALIVCPDERMWTISVWLYQFQQEATQPVGFAALTLASLPVLGAFLVAQKFILEGIVLPVEK